MSEHKTVIEYFDSFETDMSECVGLGIISFDDVAKRKLLCDNLLGLEELGNTLDDCEEKNMTYDESLKHIRKKVYRYKRVQHRKKKGQSSVLLKTETSLQENDNMAPPNSPPNNHDFGPSFEDHYKEATAVIQTLATDMSPVQIYNTLQSPAMRESLRIHPAIWRELEPELRTKMIEIRDKVEAKRKERSRAHQNRGDEVPIPSQYPNRANFMTKETAVYIIEDAMDYEDCDEDALF